MNSFCLTFDEKTFESDLVGYLEKLLQQGWNGFEFAPDPMLLPDSTYKQLISDVSFNNGQMSFHVPNFIKDKIFNPYAFGTSTQLIDNYQALFDLCGWLSGYHAKTSIQNPLVLVLHGAEFDSAHESSVGKERTLKFLDWGINYCYKQNLPLLLCLENAYSPRHLTSGADFYEAYSLLNELKGYPLGLCLDLPHLFGHSKNTLRQLCEAFSNVQEDLLPWLKMHLKHVHLHGFQCDPYQSHLPLCSSSTAGSKQHLSDDLLLLKSIDFNGNLVHEALGLSADEALNNLLSDFQLLKSWV